MPPDGLEPSSLNDLVSSLYSDLHRIADRHLRGERLDHTLQTTALLHEAYMKLSGDALRRFNNETHFLAVASRVMRQVLVDHARARATKKRSGGSDLALSAEILETERVDILELNRALDGLAQEDESLAQLVEFRYFGGMTDKETAEALGRSVHIVRHDLRLAKAWLRRELKQKP